MNPLNLAITLALLVIIILANVHFHPYFMPRQPWQWAVLGAASIFATIITEALADSFGLFPTLPKTSRYLIIVLFCAVVASIGLFALGK